MNRVLLQYYLIVKVIFLLGIAFPAGHIDTANYNRTSLSLSSFILNRLAALLRVPTAAVEMLRAANTMSGIEKKSLPTELVSLNALQFSRGILNFSFFQSNMDWIFPYWAVRQFDPGDSSFIPRAHLGLSMNVTHRNWTAVGTPECSTEPIVDPRGLVTPFRDGWSIDVWVAVDKKTYYPSRSPARQSLHEHYPVVITECAIDPILLRLSTFVDRTTLLHSLRVINQGSDRFSGSILAAIRPFNPEGVGMITSLEYREAERRVIVNGSQSVNFSTAPSQSWCSNYADGDSAWMSGDADGGNRPSSMCEVGLANGFLRFPVLLEAGKEMEIVMSVPLDEADRIVPVHSADISSGRLGNVTKYWDDQLVRGTAIETPDAVLTASIKSNLITLVMLCDGPTITPGPSSYHHFWFRDAAFMIHALDSFGHHERTRPIIENFFSHQESNGYFRSQKGEWDSNGQALWVIHQHTLLTGSDACVAAHFSALRKAVEWIDHQRMKGIAQSEQPYFGLMPAGLSAEHLGLADHYYWDNFWSLAGVRSFNALCSIVSANDDQHYGQRLFDDYLCDITASLMRDRSRLSSAAIPAAPRRNIDCGMIGSLSASYPLQLFELGPENLEATVDEITRRYCIDDVFFQHFIHSFGEKYLSVSSGRPFVSSAGGPEKICPYSIFRCSSRFTDRHISRSHPSNDRGRLDGGRPPWMGCGRIHAGGAGHVHTRNRA